MNRVYDASSRATTWLQHVLDDFYPGENLIGTCLEQGNRFECLIGMAWEEHRFVVRFRVDVATSRPNFVAESLSAADHLLAKRREAGQES